jgi:hypothetical protein
MTIKIISLFLIFSIVILIVWGIYMIHIYPGKVAKLRNHPQTRAIEVTALMGLIIFPLWILALIWAHSNAVIGKLYNGGDFVEDDEQKEAEPSLLSNKAPESKINLKKK